MKFKVYLKKSSYWELVHNDIHIKSREFDERHSAIKNLDVLLNSLVSTPICSNNENSLVFFEFKQIKNKWSWFALSKVSGAKVILDEKHNLNSYDEALESAQLFKDKIINAPILDLAGIPIPYIYFSGKIFDIIEDKDNNPALKYAKKHYE